MTKFIRKYLQRKYAEAQTLRTISELLHQHGTEYIRFCIEQDQAISTLEEYLHTSDDPREIANQTLQTACTFYGGDWAGLFEVDMDLSIWTPIWWYKPDGNDRTMKLIREFENLDVMPTWIKAMKDGQCVIIPDAADIHATQLQERTVYQRFNISSIIAVPFMPNPTGFLVIRNPSRYLSYTTMLTVSAYVLHRAVAQQKTLERTRLTLTPDRIESDKDVIINFFGNMEIYTSKGVLREQDFKSPKSTRVATYLMLHRKATHPPLEIIAAL